MKQQKKKIGISAGIVFLLSVFIVLGGDIISYAEPNNFISRKVEKASGLSELNKKSDGNLKASQLVNQNSVFFKKYDKESPVPVSYNKRSYTKKLRLDYPKVSKDYKKYLKLDSKRFIAEKSFDTSKIDMVNINSYNNDIHLYATDAKNITVIQSFPKGIGTSNGTYSRKLYKDEVFQLTSKDRSLSIKTKEPSMRQKNWDLKSTGLVNPPIDIHIFLPVSYKKDLNIYTGAGDVVFHHPMEANIIKVEAPIGDIKIFKNIMAQKFSLIANVGDIIIRGDISSNDLALDLDIGDCMVWKHLYCNNIGINMGLGDCILMQDISCRNITINIQGNLKFNKIDAEVKREINMNDYDYD